MTEKELEVLNCVKKSIQERGYPPSVREICLEVGLRSTSSVHLYLNKLEKEGYIRRNPSTSRSIEVCDGSVSSAMQPMVQVPIVGTVAAGQPILAQENITGYFPIPLNELPHEDVFMLRVKGESMINRGIFDGDFIVVESCQRVENGAIAVVLLEDSATVKTFYKEKNYIRLQPENDTMDPIIVPDVQVLGRVIGLFRSFR